MCAQCPASFSHYDLFYMVFVARWDVTNHVAVVRTSCIAQLCAVSVMGQHAQISVSKDDAKSFP